jgi:hypothetical protein
MDIPKIKFKRKRGRPKGSKDRVKRIVPPHTLKNLIHVKPGQVLNPEGKNGRRPVTDEYFLIGESVVPGPLRWRLNALLGCPACAFLSDALKMNPRPELPAKLKHADYLPDGITFNRMLGFRAYLEAIVSGDVRAMTEVREAQEGRSTLRIEMPKGNDRLQQLLDEFEWARTHPPAEDTARPIESEITGEAAQPSEPTKT